MLASRTGPDEPDTLLARLKNRIAEDGPLTIADYMEACLSDPEHGYYSTRDPFGAAGDFTTAPEISQIFGELIGLWCAVVWRQMKAPRPVKLIELGPGRGTLMADALRAAATVPEFADALEVHLVETSPVLRRLQGERLQTSGKTPQWHTRLQEVPEGAAIIIANEFLDALPVRQFERRDGTWYERCIGLSPEGTLQFQSATRALENAALIPSGLHEGAREGDLAEIRPAAETIVETIAARVEHAPVAALFIDYGHSMSAPGESLQAVRSHGYADPLDQPGAGDLTAHVDFGQLGDAALRDGLLVHGPVSQGAFLMALGLNERCTRLAENTGAEARNLIESGARRLVDQAQMGELFKVMALSSEGLAPPPFSATPAPEPGR